MKKKRRKPGRKTRPPRPARRARRPARRRSIPAGPQRCEIEVHATQGTFSLFAPHGVPMLPKAWVEAELDNGDVLTSVQGGLAAEAGFWASEVANGRITLELVFDRVAEPLGVVVRARVRNKGTEPLKVRRITVGRAAIGTPPPGWGDPAAWRVLRMGYTFGGAHREDGDPRNSALVPLDRPGVDLRSWGMAALKLDAEPCLVIGFLTGDRQLTWIDLRKEGRELDVAPSCETEGREIAPGETLEAERLYAGLHADAFAALRAYGELCARAARLSTGLKAGVELKPVPRGWCTWYVYGGKVTAADVTRNAEAVAALKRDLGWSVVQVDAGHCKAMGDWLEPSAGFPGGLAPVAGAIASLGLVPGVWLAPFAVEGGSKLLADHPDWMVAGEDGKPLPFDVEWADPKVPWFGLDATHPEARAWLAATAAAFREMGFRYFKLDFLFMGLIRGSRSRAATRVEAYREGLRAVREGAGADSYLLACTAPYPPTAGLADGIRTSHDVHTGGESIRNFAQVHAENHHRFWAHRTLWNADPDVVLVRDLEGGSPGTPRAVALSAALSGGAFMAGDAVADLTEDRLGLLKEAASVARPAAAVPLDLFERASPRLLCQPLGRGRFRVGVFNHEDASRVVPLDLARLGLERARVSVLAGGRTSRPVTTRRRYTTPPVPARGAVLLLVERP